MTPKIVHQDSSLLVINKPAGLIVNTADTVKEPTLQDWVDNNFDYQLAHDRSHRNGIVHRLDKETSGVMILAKTPKVQKAIQSQFKNRTITKTYMALVHGRLSPASGAISLPLSRSQTDRQSFTVTIGGKMTKTSYQVDKYYLQLQDPKLRAKSYQGFSLVTLQPKTGRTHQLRVVLKHLGHPIVGDGKYTGKKRARADKLWCQRQFLHAASITFTHPADNKTVSYQAPLPLDLTSAIKLLS